MTVRDWLFKHLPAGIVVRPAESFLALLCFLSGLLIVAGVSQPPAAAKLLWHPAYVAWGFSLLVGSIMLIAGLSSITWISLADVYVIKRAPAYRLGLSMLGLASLAYGAAIAITGGWNGALAASMAAAFSASCLIRLLTLGRGR